MSTLSRYKFRPKNMFCVLSIVNIVLAVTIKGRRLYGGPIRAPSSVSSLFDVSPITSIYDVTAFSSMDEVKSTDFVDELRHTLFASTNDATNVASSIPSSSSQAFQDINQYYFQRATLELRILSHRSVTFSTSLVSNNISCSI